MGMSLDANELNHETILEYSNKSWLMGINRLAYLIHSIC